MGLIIILAAYLRFSGMNWGIPQEPYFRNHYQDEAFVLGLLFKMEPPNLNPHYFINPTLHYYTLLFSLKIASLFNYLKPFSLPIKTNNLGQPEDELILEDYGNMYRVGRFLSILEGILLVLLVFFIGRNLYNEKVGIISALFTAILPTLIYQTHFLTVDAASVFWLILAFYFLSTKIPSEKITLWFIGAGIFIGLAVGSKYTNILIFLPFFYKVYLLNKNKKILLLKKIFPSYVFVSILISIVTFFITTPYALISFNEFLNGDKNGFGGIFGQRGLFYYNAYPTNLISPFTVATFQSLRLPLTILAILGIIYLIYKRKHSDILLLSFIICFYLMLIYHASPHLRHILMVLPFLMIALARMIEDLLVNKRFRKIKPIVVSVAIGTFVYTLLFSLAMVKRMTPVDTRIECANWIKENLSGEATFGLASFFPWNYTPPIEKFTDKIGITGYNYENLIKLSPDYFIITENEYREFPYARESPLVRERFVNLLFRESDYKIIKKFYQDFQIFGIKFLPKYPNMDWNQVNPVIYIFQKTKDNFKG